MNPLRPIGTVRQRDPGTYEDEAHNFWRGTWDNPEFLTSNIEDLHIGQPSTRDSLITQMTGPSPGPLSPSPEIQNRLQDRETDSDLNRGGPRDRMPGPSAEPPPPVPTPAPGPTTSAANPWAFQPGANYATVPGFDPTKLADPNKLTPKYSESVRLFSQALAALQPASTAQGLQQVVDYINAQLGGRAKVVGDDKIDFGDGAGPIDVQINSGKGGWWFNNQPGAGGGGPAAPSGPQADGRNGVNPRDDPSFRQYDPGVFTTETSQAAGRGWLADGTVVNLADLHIGQSGQSLTPTPTPGPGSTPGPQQGGVGTGAQYPTPPGPITQVAPGVYRDRDGKFYAQGFEGLVPWNTAVWGPPPTGDGTSGGPVGAGAGGPGTPLGGPASTGDVTQTMRDALLELMRSTKAPVSMEDPIIKGQSDAYALRAHRGQQDRRAMMAERLAAQGLNPGGQGSGAFESAIERGAQDTGEAIAGHDTELMQTELQARRDQLTRALGLAQAVGAHSEALQLTRQLADLDRQFRYAQLRQQGTEFGQGLGFNYAQLQAELNRQALLAAMGG